MLKMKCNLIEREDVVKEKYIESSEITKGGHEKLSSHTSNNARDLLSQFRNIIMLGNRRHRTTKHICILYPKRIPQSQYIPCNTFSHRFDQSENESQGEETIVKRKSTMSILISRNERSKSMPSNIDGKTIRRLIRNIIFYRKYIR